MRRRRPPSAVPAILAAGIISSFSSLQRPDGCGWFTRDRIVHYYGLKRNLTLHLNIYTGRDARLTYAGDFYRHLSLPVSVPPN